jgi:pyruvate/2-oxoglutarate/acetoin dehydrogenase E1 component/TPP-dependent pyruvate/acetoin dehydrogenase alpha subunit
MSKAETATQSISKQEFKAAVIDDYRIAFKSRQASLIGRKEVLTGKAKFGIFGDGKEVAQVAMAKFFEKGDFRSGYYRDQTFMFAKGMSDLEAYFAQLYAHPNVEAEPASAGRSMNGHFATRLLDQDGEWLSQTERFNSSADISPTAGQMPRLLGLAWASKLYRNNPELKDFKDFSIKGNEIAWGTIGNASTSEGHFWEVVNAAGVLQVPMLLSIWDDGYGISVPAKYQTTKENLSSILSGFKTDKDGQGIELLTVKGWDYPELIKTYQKAAELCRDKHTPVVIHVTEITQPQGHSTSGSHERYKSEDRLKWEQEFDCLTRMKSWMIEKGIVSEEEIESLEKTAIDEVKNDQKSAWKAFQGGIKEEIADAVQFVEDWSTKTSNPEQFKAIATELKTAFDPIRKDIMKMLDKAILKARFESDQVKADINRYRDYYLGINRDRYNSHLYSESAKAVSKMDAVSPEWDDSADEINGFEVLQRCFDYHLTHNPKVVAFGEDVGKIGDVNQGFAGLQEKHGEHRVMDTGIREMSIVGQAVGSALRGLRPIAEIQYLDYLLYGLQTLSDDVATMQYRTKGGQKIPLIIRTRGHRLEGIWHSGSPMGMIINSLRGMLVLVPRNMVQAAGFYNTVLDSDEPALIVECLNGYRLKEKAPSNIGEFKVIPGYPEVLREGSDITLVTYGSCVRIAQEGIKLLEEAGISVELIDVQSLLPFDVDHSIVESLKKTNKVVFMDEDVPGGATAFMMREVLEKQEGYLHLDAAPKTITSRAHRPAYGTDGDYFSKSNPEDVFRTLYQMMHEYDPVEYPSLGN